MAKLLLIFAFVPLLAFGNQEIIGQWKFSELIYKGQKVPLPNPDLNLTWTFFKNGTERLYWDRGTADFCERFSYYIIEDSNLLEESFFLNPRNAADCSKDPDMQVGKKTKIKMNFALNELHFYFQLGEEELIYVLKPITE